MTPVTGLATQVSDHLSKSPSLESIQTVVKSNLLKFNMQKKLLSTILGEAAVEQDFSELRQYQQSANFYLTGCFSSLDSVQKYLANGCNLAEQYHALTGEQ